MEKAFPFDTENFGNFKRKILAKWIAPQTSVAMPDGTNVFKLCYFLLSRQFARQKAAELEDFQGSTAPLGEGVLGWYQQFAVRYRIVCKSYPACTSKSAKSAKKKK